MDPEAEEVIIPGLGSVADRRRNQARQLATALGTELLVYLVRVLQEMSTKPSRIIALSLTETFFAVLESPRE